MNTHTLWEEQTVLSQFNHLEMLRCLAATSGEGEPTIWLCITDTENPLLFYTSDLHILSFLSLYCSNAVWEPRYPCSWTHFPCGWHNILPLHCVFVYGRIFPHGLADTSVSSKWDLVWLRSKLHKWVSSAQKGEEKRPLRFTAFNLYSEERSNYMCGISLFLACWTMTQNLF